MLVCIYPDGISPDGISYDTSLFLVFNLLEIFARMIEFTELFVTQNVIYWL